MHTEEKMIYVGSQNDIQINSFNLMFQFQLPPKKANSFSRSEKARTVKC